MEGTEAYLFCGEEDCYGTKMKIVSIDTRENRQMQWKNPSAEYMDVSVALPYSFHG